jgi:hypothetical protein
MAALTPRRAPPACPVTASAVAAHRLDEATP